MMQSNIKASNPKMIVDHIPNGNYKGKWGGYVVKFNVGLVEYQVDTEIGVRGIDIPCIVSVLEGGDIFINEEDET